MLVRLTSVNFGAWSEQGWFFDPLAWQFLFIIGVLLACAPMRMPSRPRLLDAASVVVLAAGVVVTLAIDPHPRWLEWSSNTWLRYLVEEDKTGLHPFRLASILALTWLTIRLVRFHQPWLSARWSAPFILLGQNSLPVFCSGIVIGFVARLGLEYDDGALMQAGANLLGAFGMVGVGALAAWYRTKGKGPQQRVKDPSRTGASPQGVLLPVHAQPDTG
jgi:hypothetical protein